MFLSKVILPLAALAAAVVAAPVEKRNSGKATYFQVGTGACGWNSQASEKVVAISSDLYGNSGSKSSHCGRQVEIHHGGKTEKATVVDECPPCNKGSLDMSKSLFSSLTNGNLDLGEFDMSWNWAN